jgi:hypothetical protein
MPFVMARRPEKHEVEVFTQKDLEEIRYNLAHLSEPAVRDAYEQAYKDCQMIYGKIPSPKSIQILVQVWKQLWKWR